MQTSFLHPSCSSLLIRQSKRVSFDPRQKRFSNSVFAFKRDAKGKDDRDGKLVDDNMIVLRMRIQEMEMAEKKHEPPSNWMAWEKKYFANYNYDSDIIEAIGYLQVLLMETRPSLVLGGVLLLIFNVSTPVIVVLSHLMNVIHGF